MANGAGSVVVLEGGLKLARRKCWHTVVATHSWKIAVEMERGGVVLDVLYGNWVVYR